MVRPQPEFVVDLLKVCNVINMEAACTNVDYKAPFDRMLSMLSELYEGPVSHKAGFLATHDWRPREFNPTADRLCNIALDIEEDIHHDFGIDAALR